MLRKGRRKFPRDILQRLGRSRSNSLRALTANNFNLCKRQGRGVSARAHVHTLILYLTNGFTDCGKTWCAVTDPLNMSHSQVLGIYVYACL